MKPSFSAIELTDREIRQRIRSINRRLAWDRWRFQASNDAFKLWHGFWRPLVYFWLKVGGAVFLSAVSVVLAGKCLKVLF